MMDNGRYSDTNLIGSIGFGYCDNNNDDKQWPLNIPISIIVIIITITELIIIIK